MILPKSERDGGGFGNFRHITVSEANAIAESERRWRLGDKVAQRGFVWDRVDGVAQRFALGDFTPRDVETMLVEETTA
jgi:hypothetical protein